MIRQINLEVLKHLKHAYKNQIKMIYIDPPYNTGSDGFVYQDDRKFTPQQLVELGMDLEEAERVLEFTANKSNSHSAWLTFIYPRLYIARELLREDGVIFISIDDNEQAQLKLLCDEVFGEENFVAELPWKGRGGGADDKNLLQNHEYILMYTKYKEQFTVGRKIKSDEKFPKFDTEKNRFYKTQLARKWGSNSKKQDRPNLFYSITTYDGIEIAPKLPDGSDGCWRWKKGRLETAILNKDIELNITTKQQAQTIQQQENANKVLTIALQQERDAVIEQQERNDEIERMATENAESVKTIIKTQPCAHTRLPQSVLDRLYK
ncbi:type III restriction-modification system EcoPI enzyme mod [Haemophilus influenzae HK1212]|uniref:site-specific DNA-methyltransferase (adenine-specific) n=2 Tax=Haemophilus influenzae HK1212 TaxID=456482 RepID=A0A7G2K1F0_HAEIF|nr:type III restriction-modification system EcoPI enzyme mod [Haemophilus influenzae HK1212]